MYRRPSWSHKLIRKSYRGRGCKRSPLQSNSIGDPSWLDIPTVPDSEANMLLEESLRYLWDDNYQSLFIGRDAESEQQPNRENEEVNAIISRSHEVLMSTDWAKKPIINPVSSNDNGSRHEKDLKSMININENRLISVNQVKSPRNLAYTEGLKSNSDFSSEEDIGNRMTHRVKVIAGRWNLKSVIGTGSFGMVFNATDLTTMKEVAVKVERPDVSFGFLKKEASILEILNTKTKSQGIPKMFYKGTAEIFGGTCDAMVMEKLGPSLQKTLEHGSLFSPESAFRVGLQMLERLRQLHFAGYVHQDIKPANILVGVADPSILFLIDFGLAAQFRFSKIVKTTTRYIGTAFLSSIAGNKGLEQYPRDDLFALGYMLVFLVKGTLPWLKSVEIEPSALHEMTARLKEDTSLHELCDGLSGVFKEYFDVIHKRGRLEFPDYDGLKELFRRELQ